MRKKVIPRFQLTPKRIRFGTAGEGNESSVNVFSSSTERVRIEVVAAGDAHALAVTTTGEIYAWGRGTSGQLGNGGTADCLEPERVRGFGDNTVKDSESGRAKVVACGLNHSLALTTEHRVFSWGGGGGRMLGQGDRETGISETSMDLSDPAAASSSEAAMEGFALANASNVASAATKLRLKRARKAAEMQAEAALLAKKRRQKIIFSGGLNEGDEDDELSTDQLELQNRLGFENARAYERPWLMPRAVNALDFSQQSEHVVAIDGGCHFSVALTSSGAMYKWGQWTDREVMKRIQGTGNMHYVQTIKHREPTPILVSSLAVMSSATESTKRRLDRISYGNGDDDGGTEEEDDGLGLEDGSGDQDDGEKTKSAHLRAAARRTALRERLQRLQKARRRAEAQGVRVDHDYSSHSAEEDNSDYAVRCAPLEVS